MELPDAIYNWLINFHQDRSHATKYSGLIFTITRINASIAQGSGIGPTAYDVGASDLHPIDQANVIVKFACSDYDLRPRPHSYVLPTKNDRDFISQGFNTTITLSHPSIKILYRPFST